MTKAKEIGNADVNPGCGNLEMSAVGAGVLIARSISYIDADAEQARKNTIKPRPVAAIIEVD